MSNINVIMENEQPITVVMDDEKPVTVTIAGGANFGTTDIFSGPPSGCYQIVNLYLDASLNIVVVYNDVAIP